VGFARSANPLNRGHGLQICAIGIPETKLILQSIINENWKYKIQAKDLLKQLN